MPKNFYPYHYQYGLSHANTVVLKVQQSDGTWANRGMTVDEFVLNPQGNFKFGKDLETPTQRAEFLQIFAD